MGNLISFVLLLLMAASGFLLIYLVIDFFEYLKKYHSMVWEKLCFEQPFGIPQKDFIFYPIKPFKIIPFFLSPDGKSFDSLGLTISKFEKIPPWGVAGTSGFRVFPVLLSCLFSIS